MKKAGIILAVILTALFFAACGSVALNEGPQNEEERPVPVRVQPDYSFSVKRKNTESPDGFFPLCVSENSFYGTLTERTGEDIPADVIRQAEKKKEKVYNDGRYDVLETSLCRISSDGKFYRMNSYHPLGAAENTEEWNRFSSVSGISGITMKNDKYLLVLECQSSSGLSSKGGTVFEYDNSWFLRTIGGKTGQEYDRTEIDNPDGLFFNGTDMMLASDGSLLIRADKEDGSSVCIISPEGEITGCVSYGGKIFGSFFLNNGYYAIYGERAGTKFVSVPEFQQGTFADYAFLPENADKVYSGSGIYPFFYDDSIAVYGYVPEMGSYEKIFTWAELKTDPAQIITAVSFGEGNTVRFLAGGSESAAVSVVTATASVAEDDTEDESKIILLTAAPSDALTEAVNDFNASAGKCYIEIEDCSSYISPDSPEESICGYIFGEMNGRYPDIIDLNGIVWQKLAKAGVLEDLYPFISDDRELNAGDYFANVLKLSEFDGKLCTTCSGFYIDTLIGEKNSVGYTPGWTYSDLDYALSKKNGTEAFEAYTVSSDVLRRCITTDMGLFVNYENGSCSFNSPEFISLLEFSASFPETFDLSWHVWNDLTDCSDLRCRSGKQLLLNSTLRNMADISRAGYEFTGDIVFIGYPTTSGNGNAIGISSYGSGGNLAMCSFSEKKQEAWKFLRTFFTEEYQKDIPFIPSCRRVFDSQLESAMKVYYVVDAKGKKVISKKTGLPQERARDTIYLSDYTAVKYYAVTEERSEEIMDLITGTEKLITSDRNAVGIILSCADEYFSGQISSADAAGKIQALMEEYVKIPPLTVSETVGGELQ